MDSGWFYLDTYVHTSVKKDWILLYNPLNGKFLEYAQQPVIARLVKRMTTGRNMLVARLSKKDLDNSVISQFVEAVRESFMGDIIDVSLSSGRPAQMVPRLTIEKDVKRLEKAATRSVGEDLMKYLSEVTLFVTGECNVGCQLCHSAYKQFLCCTTPRGGKSTQQLDIDDIDQLFANIGGSRLVNINIVGGDLLNYYALEELLERVHLFPSHKTFYQHYLNAASPFMHILYGMMAADPDTFLKIPVTFPIREKEFAFVVNNLNRANLMQSARFHFIIRDESQFEKVETLISSYQISASTYQPFYDGTNLDFFRENIFTGREDIFGSRPQLPQIHQRAAVNNLNFGRLIVLSDGSYHTNVNLPRMGVIDKDSVFDVLYREMVHGRSWRRIRRNVEPCKRCIFDKLCPPLSDYTFAIGRNNLCTIYP